jgi:N-acetylneuraminic acid mutarotase
MRSVVLLVLTACGFPRPPDKCEGPCALFAVDRSLAIENNVIWLDGTFEVGMQVNYPGGQQQGLDIDGEHRVGVTVPATVTAGDLTITTSEGTTPPIPFRRTTFKHTLQPFMVVNEQNDYGRITMVDVAYAGSTAVAIGNRVYFLGGANGAAATDDVLFSTAGLDGGLSKPKSISSLTLPRAYHSSLVIGSYVYVFGGLGGGGTSVERAPIDGAGKLGAFEIVPGVTLEGGRSGHATVIVGNHVYLFGGKSMNGGEVATIERAPILNGDLGSFQGVDVQMTTPRQRFAVVKQGLMLSVIGGTNNNQPLDSIERVMMRTDGTLGAFEPGGTLTTARAGHAAVTVGDEVYVFGGANSAGSLDSVEHAMISQQDPLMFTSGASKLNFARQDATTVSVGNYVYLLGGFESTTTTPNPILMVERASIIAGGTLEAFETAPMTGLSTARHSHASVVIGKYLYVIGGVIGTTAQTSIEIAEIRPDGTLSAFATAFSSLQTPRYGHSVLINDNVLYVLGGKTNNNQLLATIESATITDDGGLERFETYAAVSLPTPRGHFSLWGTRQVVHVMGGADSTTSFTSSLDFAFLNFGPLQPFMNGGDIVDPREGAASIMLHRYAYVIGGFDSLPRGIVRAPLSNYGGLDNMFVVAGGLQRPRRLHVVTMVGNTLYVIGGENLSAMQPIESAQVSSDGSLTPFALTLGLTLVNPRAGATTVTIGNFVYVIGGRNVGQPLGSIEYATISSP